VTWVAVSPAYQHTGTVLAVGSVMGCSTNCNGLWVTHDGGASWRRAAAHNWPPSRVVIASDDHLHETFFAASSASLMRSDDGGDTWSAAGTGGMPTVLPTYASDRSVVVAAAGGPYDYLLHNVTPDEVTGSNGSVQDLAFAASPTYPSGGAFSPALLVGLDRQSKLPVVFRCTADFSCNGGTPLQLGVPASSMTSTATLLYPAGDYAQSGAVFADTPMGIQKSVDGGATFSPLAVAPAPNAAVNATPMMALAPGYRESGPVRTAYASVFQAYDPQSRRTSRTAGGVYRTLDGGKSWSPLITTGAFSGGSQAVASAPDGRLFASYFTGTPNVGGSNYAGLLCSTDGGASWHPSCPPDGDHRGEAANQAGCGSCRQSQTGTQPSNPNSSVNGGYSGDKNGGSQGAGNAGLGATPASAHATTGSPVWHYALGGVSLAALLSVLLMRRPWRRARATTVNDDASG